MPTVQLAPNIKFRVPLSNGAGATGWKLFTYAAGTVTSQTTYTDASGTSANTNPIFLNSRGECDLWLDVTKAYKLVVTNPAGAVLWTADNITASSGTGGAGTVYINGSDTVSVAGSGTALDPFVLEAIVSPDAANLLQVRDNGLYVEDHDGKVKVSENDAEGYLENKVRPGDGIAISKLTNPGGEYLEIRTNATSDTVTNLSTVSGSNVTEALDTLEGQIVALEAGTLWENKTTYLTPATGLPQVVRMEDGVGSGNLNPYGVGGSDPDGYFDLSSSGGATQLVTDVSLTLQSNGLVLDDQAAGITIPSQAGTGTRALVVGPTGEVSNQAFPDGGSGQQNRLLVPYYGTVNLAKIDQLIVAHRKTPEIEMVVILNPTDGFQITSTSADCQTAIDRMTESGIKVLGYVTSLYGGTDFGYYPGITGNPAYNVAGSVIYPKIDAWGTFYTGISGFFIDEIWNGYGYPSAGWNLPLTAEISFYKAISDYCYNRGEVLVMNAGTDVYIDYFNQIPVDAFVISETYDIPAVPYLDGTANAAGTKYVDRSKKGAIVHTQPTLNLDGYWRMKQYCGWLYSTSEGSGGAGCVWHDVSSYLEYESRMYAQVMIPSLTVGVGTDQPDAPADNPVPKLSVVGFYERAGSPSYAYGTGAGQLIDGLHTNIYRDSTDNNVRHMDVVAAGLGAGPGFGGAMQRFYASDAVDGTPQLVLELDGRDKTLTIPGYATGGVAKYLTVGATGEVASAAIPDLSGYVPYTGATTHVNLNGKNLSNVAALSTTAATTLAALATGGAAKYLIIDAVGLVGTTPIPSLTGYVPYTGATGDVDLGAHNLNAASVRGGTTNYAYLEENALRFALNGDSYIKGGGASAAILIRPNGTDTRWTLTDTAQTQSVPLTINSTVAGVTVNAGASVSGLTMYRSDTSGGNIGRVNWQANDSLGNATTFARAYGTAEVSTDTQEMGALRLATAYNGTVNDQIVAYAADKRVDVLGLSTTTIASHMPPIIRLTDQGNFGNWAGGEAQGTLQFYISDTSTYGSGRVGSEIAAVQAGTTTTAKNKLVHRVRFYTAGSNLLDAFSYQASSATATSMVIGTAGTDALTIESSVTANAAISSYRASTALSSYNIYVTGDGVARYNLLADGKQEWGDGTAARDTNLYRSAANTLKTDDSMLALTFQAERPNSTDALFYGRYTTGGTGYAFAILADGKYQMGPGDGTYDTNLYRSAANTLKTDDAFVANTIDITTTPTGTIDKTKLLFLNGTKVTYGDFGTVLNNYLPYTGASGNLYMGSFGVYAGASDAVGRNYMSSTGMVITKTADYIVGFEADSVTKGAYISSIGASAYHRIDNTLVIEAATTNASYSGASLALSDGSWIRPVTVGQSVYVTNGASPAANNSLAVESSAVGIRSIGATYTGSIQVEKDSSAYMSMTKAGETLGVAMTASTNNISLIREKTGVSDAAILMETTGTTISYDAGTPKVIVVDAQGVKPSANAGIDTTKVLSLDANGAIQMGTVTTGGAADWLIKTANYTAANKDSILADTSGGAFAVTLPATPSAGASVKIALSCGSGTVNTLTVARNGSTIEGAAADVTMTANRLTCTFVFTGTDWRILNA